MNRIWGTHTTPTVGAELKRLRDDREWSLRTLGRRTRYDFSFLSRIEKGERRASKAVVEKLDAELEAGGTLLAAWRAENRVARPAQLPAAPTRFVGRDEQLAEMAQALTDRRAAPPVVIAIDGPAGAGKTALALRCAHDLSSRFFDGQLYVDLGGFAASPTDAADPTTVLHWFCIALGAAPDAIPAAAAERAALYRSLMADRRVLVVLDNAVDSRHVELLLPGTGRCAAIVTSRRVLSGLTVQADAHRLPVGPLAEVDSAALVTQLIGVERAHREPDAVLALTRVCGDLPLALRIAADRVAAHPEQPIQAIVGDLTTDDRRLDYLETGDSPGVRTVISWSYSRLSTGAARMFRLLGLHGGSIVGARAASALAGVDFTTALHHLRDLDRVHLVELGSNETVRLHGLLRAYTHEQSQVEDEPSERIVALERLLAWYSRTTWHECPHSTEHAAPSDECQSSDRRDHGDEPGSSLQDFVGTAEAARDHGPAGGTWLCAAALWDGLRIQRNHGASSDSEELAESTALEEPTRGGTIAISSDPVRAIPQQTQRGHGRDLANHAMAWQSDTTDKHGLAWTLAGAALVASRRDEDDLAEDFAQRARHMFLAIGDDRDAVMLRMASALQRVNGLSEIDDALIAEAARLVAETADYHGCRRHRRLSRTAATTFYTTPLAPLVTAARTKAEPHDTGGP